MLRKTWIKLINKVFYKYEKKYYNYIYISTFASYLNEMSNNKYSNLTQSLTTVKLRKNYIIHLIDKELKWVRTDAIDTAENDVFKLLDLNDKGDFNENN